MKIKRRTMSLILVVILTQFIFFANCVFAQEPVVNIIKPAKDLTVMEGYDLVVTVSVGNIGSVERVEFYREGVILLGVLTEHDAGNETLYTYVWENIPIGTFNVSARVVDSDGNMYYTNQNRSISSKPYLKTAIVNEDFDNVMIDFIAPNTEAPGLEPTEYSVVMNSDTKWLRKIDGTSLNIQRGTFSRISSVPSPDGKQGQSIRLSKSAGEFPQTNNFTNEVARLRYDTKILPKQILSLEANFYFENLNSVGRFLIWANTTSQFWTPGFNSTGLITGNPGESEKPGIAYFTNTWYNLRLEINEVQRYMDLYINNERVVHQLEYVNSIATLLDRDGISNTVINLGYIPNNQSNVTYVDDFKISYYTEDIYSTGIDFTDSAGNITSSNIGVPVDTKSIGIKFNKALSSVGSGDITLAMVSDDDEYPIELNGVYNNSAQSYIFTVNSPLREFTRYKCYIKSGIAGMNDGIATKHQVIDFVTKKPDFWVDEVIYHVSSLAHSGGLLSSKVYFKNSGNTQVPVVIVTALYRDGEIEDIVYKKSVVPAEQESFNVPVYFELPPDKNNCVVKTYVWPQLVMFKPYHTAHAQIQ